MRFGEGVHFFANRAGLFLPLGRLLAVTFQFFFRNKRDFVGGAGVGEKGLEPVVIGLADRVILMVMTTGAGHGQAHEYRCRGVGDVVEDFLPALHQVSGVALVGVMAVEGGGDPRVRILRPEFIAGNLLFEEAVVGLVVVE